MQKELKRFSGTVLEVGFWTRINACRVVFLELDLWVQDDN
jgi:hypothetical protein